MIRTALLVVIVVGLVAGLAPAPAGAAIWRPAPGTSWQIQYTGTINLQLNVAVFNLDLFDTSAATIAGLHDRGTRVICYFSAGSFEEWRPDAESFVASSIGEPLADWEGEAWLDIRRTSVRRIMAKRLDLAVTKGCDAVDPDNVDGYIQDSGFPLTASNQLSYNRYLATEAHNRGLAIGLKNDLDQVTRLVKYFDFAVNESCAEYDECETLLPFIEQGKAVFGIEYGGSSTARRVCPAANALDFDTLVKRLSLDATRIACR